MLLTDWRAAVLGDRFDARGQHFAKKRTAPQTRAAFLKLFLTREGFQMAVGLDPERKEAAYQFGRLMAVLARVQRKALGPVGAGVVARYYGRASTNPAEAFGKLLDLSNKHVAKLSPGAQRRVQDDIAEIVARCDVDAVTGDGSLSNVDQTLFALGYYQQIAHDRAAQKRAKAERDSKNPTPDTSEEE